MDAKNLVDNSPFNPVKADLIPSAKRIALIDNYDSFTHNVAQYLWLEGAQAVEVFRNDQITLPQLIDWQPTQLVVSPGPGHPDTDSGISKIAISHFAGKIPILGVCMGEQCVYSVFGGEVETTGEIMHGKTSLLEHDGKWLYAGLDQNVPVTRYHSLAGTHPSLPSCLEVTSWLKGSAHQHKGIIMGVRHREYTIEGVQYHPESILTEGGRLMISNFLKLVGGTWAENEKSAVGLLSATLGENGAVAREQAPLALPLSILDKIFEQRRHDVELQKVIPSLRPVDFERNMDLSLAPPQISFPDRLRQSPFSLSLMAEIKRASPSKGVIALSTSAAEQAREYALAGASAISVLTEPKWFQGSVNDLRAVRQSLNGFVNRPAILCKEFIFDVYQILEARLAGADTILLIVKMLSTEQLKELYLYSSSIGMEPLVEVNTEDEMKVAIELGAKVIGVNNRNLVNFEVDMNTTTRLMSMVPDGTILCALSGISGPEDVTPYSQIGVGAVLVGEALMRAKNTAKFVNELFGGDLPNKFIARAKRPLLVKICGTRTPEAAQTAVEAGADLIGMILVQGRSRCVTPENAKAISKIVRNFEKGDPMEAKTEGQSHSLIAEEYFEHSILHKVSHPTRALLVGVFRNQPLSYVLEQQRLLNLDIVQLHGSEPLEWAQSIPVPVIRAFGSEEYQMGVRGYHAIPLVDAGAGGSGDLVDMLPVSAILKRDAGLQIFLAGGLRPDNIHQVVNSSFAPAQIAGVDVSSGVEEDGKQSIEKIRAFVKAAKAFR